MKDVHHVFAGAQNLRPMLLWPSADATGEQKELQHKAGLIHVVTL